MITNNKNQKEEYKLNAYTAADLRIEHRSSDYMNKFKEKKGIKRTLGKDGNYYYFLKDKRIKKEEYDNY